MKSLYCEDGVCGKCYRIEVWMIDHHLLDISSRTLRIDDLEACPEIIERQLNGIDLVTVLYSARTRSLADPIQDRVRPEAWYVAPRRPGSVRSRSASGSMSLASR